jgi:hypothetical protein
MWDQVDCRLLLDSIVAEPEVEIKLFGIVVEVEVVNVNPILCLVRFVFVLF